MRNMSFAMTTEQVRNQDKTVTRRFGWWYLQPGDVVQPVVKGMGLRKGEKVEKIGPPIRIVSTRTEALRDMTDEDCVREGFPEMDRMAFINMLCLHYCTVGPCTYVNRIEFEYLDNADFRALQDLRESCTPNAHVEGFERSENTLRRDVGGTDQEGARER